MADDLGYTPGSGATIATDEVNGRHWQGIKPAVGDDGEAVFVSRTNPMPMQEQGGANSLLTRLFNLLSSPIGFDKALGRQRVTAAVESGVITTVTTVTTCSTVSNIAAGTITTVGGLTNIDGRNGAMLINQTNLSAWQDCVRSRIT